MLQENIYKWLVRTVIRHLAMNIEYDTGDQWKHVLWSGENKLELFSSKEKKYLWRKPNTEHEPSPKTLSSQSSMVVAASCCGDAFHPQALGNS